MRTLPLACVPKENIYYYATQITRRGATRFYIETTLCDAPDNRYFETEMPIESILLYHYKTPLNQIEPVSLVNRKLTQINLGILNKTNAENPTVNTHPTYRNRPCFSFQYHNLGDALDGWTIQIPKLVFGRDLLFSHPYFLRAALFAERYTTDVLIDRNEKKAFHIFIAPNRKITTKDLKDPVFLQRLALILLYPELNQTFLSVYEKTIANQAHSPAYHFDMDAPVLDNMQLDVDGLMYPEKKIYRIERINTFENLETGIKKPITFHVVTQKRLGEIKDILGENKGKKPSGSQDKSKLDSKANADIDQQITQLRNKVGRIITIEDLRFSIHASRSEIAGQGGNTGGTNDSIEQGFAGGEAQDDGTLPGFTIDSGTTFVDDHHHNFFLMVKEIEKKGYKVENIHNKDFVKCGRFKGHKLKNGKNRRFYITLILDQNDNELFYLCEIDTSDGKKNISTLMLRYDHNSNKLMNRQIELFKIAILSQSLSWPKEFLTKIHDIKPYTINHPAKDLIAVDARYYEDWAERILEKWHSVKNSSSPIT